MHSVKTVSGATDSALIMKAKETSRVLSVRARLASPSNPIHPPEGLRRIAAQGFLLVILLKGIGVIVGRFAQLVLPLFLLPSDFGIFALASFFFGITALVADLGMPADLVRRRDRFAEAAQSAFSLRLALSLGLTIGSFFVAWAASVLFHEPRLFLPTVVLSVGLLLQTLSMVPRAIAARALDYRRLTLPDHAGKFSGAFVTIGLAIGGFAYWSPVYGTLAGLGIGTAAQMAVTRWWPRLSISREVLADVIRFGRFVMLTSLANFIAHSVDSAIVGLLLGVTSLGLYSFAYSWGVYFTSNLSSVFATVGYPLLSRVADSPDRLKRVLLENLRYYGYVAGCLSVSVLVLAPVFVASLYDATWLPAVVPMQILAIAGLVLGYGGVIADALNAKGASRIVFAYAWAEAGILVAILPLATAAGGLVGTSIAAVLGALFFTFGLARSARVHVGTTIGDWFRMTAAQILAAVAAGVAGYAIGVLSSPSLPSLVVGAAVVVSVYFSTLQAASAGKFWNEMRGMLRLAARS